MKTNGLFRHENNLILTLSLILIFLLAGSDLKAQTTTDFSGKWKFDLKKSNLGEGTQYWVGDEILDITQNSSSVTVARILLRSGSEDFKSTETFILDGKEKITKEDFGTSRITAKWSEDKKSFTVTNLATTVFNGVSKDYLVADTYKLSDKGITLTIESYSKNDSTGERTTTMVYNRQ